jgi:signal transduction histidine kinase
MTSIAYSAGMAVANIRLLQRSVQAERMATVGSTAASLSHYIKNILTGLEGSVSLLRMGIDSSDTEIMNEAWDILANNQKFLSSLVLDMLSLAREEPLELAQYNLTETVIEAVDLIRNRADQDNIQIEMNEAIRDTHLLTTFDARAVHRVVMNVLNHGVERARQTYGRSGDGIVRIDLTEDVPGDLGIIEISDNCGILDDEQLTTLFADIQSGQSGRGTGLGLVVAQRLITQHQCELVVSNRKEVGITMTVRLPLRREHDHLATGTGLKTPSH